MGCVGQGRVPRVGWEMGQVVPVWGSSALPQPQAQVGGAAGSKGTAGKGGLIPYLSLPRGGLGSVEHLLPPLHPRHGLHVLAPVAHFHGALLPGRNGDRAWRGGSRQPHTIPPHGTEPCSGSAAALLQTLCPVGLGLAGRTASSSLGSARSGCAGIPAQSLAKLHWEARKSQKISLGGKSQHVGLTPELHQTRAEPFSAQEAPICASSQLSGGTGVAGDTGRARRPQLGQNGEVAAALGACQAPALPAHRHS